MQDGREVLTQWGKRWYRENPIQRVINVPIQVVGTRQNGSTYRRARTTTPLEWTANIHESDPTFVEKMLARVHQTLPDVYTQSNEEVEVLYSTPASTWTVSRRTVSVGADGAVRSSVMLDQPLGAPDGRHSYAPLPDHIVDRP